MICKTVTFRDLLSKIIDNRGKTCPTSETGTPLIATNCVRNDSLYPLFEKVRYVDDETHRSWFRGHPTPGEMLFVTKGTPGRICLVPNPVNFCIAQDMLSIRANEKIVYSKFLFALIRSVETQRMIENMYVGTLIPHFKKGDFDQLYLSIPSDRKVQEKIGDFYFNLSEKIELNRQTNATLEAIAQAIFKEWFVDFRFPGATGEMQGSEIGPIPLGWKAAKLEEMASIKHGFAFKGAFFSKEETDEILITPGNFRIGGGFNYSKFKYYDGVYPSEYLLNDGDLIVTMTDLSKNGDTLGYPALVPQISGKKLLHNQRIGKLEFHKESILKLYLYFVMRQNDYQNYVLSGATGTTVRHTSPGRICDYMLVLPTTTVLRQFEKVIQGLINNIEFSFLQNQVLAQTRDTLLPKLISGEIKV